MPDPDSVAADIEFYVVRRRVDRRLLDNRGHERGSGFIRILRARLSTPREQLRRRRTVPARNLARIIQRFDLFVTRTATAS